MQGERYITDDNANPPVCYNYGKCLAISSDAATVADASKRPQITAPGLVTLVTGTPGTLTSAQVRDERWLTRDRLRADD